MDFNHIKLVFILITIVALPIGTLTACTNEVAVVKDDKTTGSEDENEIIYDYAPVIMYDRHMYRANREYVESLGETVDLSNMKMVGKVKKYIKNRPLNNSDEDFSCTAPCVGKDVYLSKSGSLFIEEDFGYSEWITD